MLSFGNITDADLDVAVHADPSTDPVVWQKGAETIDEYFKPGGTFWSEPINSNGEYMSEGSASMSISEASGGLRGNSSRNRIGIGTPNGKYVSEGSKSMSISEASDGIGGSSGSRSMSISKASGGTGGSSSGNRIGLVTSSDNNISSNVGTSSIIGGAMNGLNITIPNGGYISEGSKSMSISSGSGNGSRSMSISSGSDIGSGTGNKIGIGTSTDNNISPNIGTSSVIGGAMNGYSTVHWSSDNPPPPHVIMRNNYIQRRFPPPPVRPRQQQHPGSDQNTTYDSSPPTTQSTKHGPIKRTSPDVDIKQPTQSEKIQAKLSYPVTPQLGTPYVRGRTTRSTKGAEELRREMEEQKQEDTPVTSASNNPKRKRAAETPGRPRKQPKRAAKNKK